MKYQERRSILYSLLEQNVCKYGVENVDAEERMRCCCSTKRKRHLFFSSRKNAPHLFRLQLRSQISTDYERNHVNWMTHRLLSLPPPVRLGLRYSTNTACHN